MWFIGGIVTPEIDWAFLHRAQEEMHRVSKRDSYAAMYGSAKGWEAERDFMVMYLMGGEI